MASRSTLKEVVFKFLTDHRLGVLATVDAQGIPHAAPVYCVVRKDLDIYFSTRVEGRKFDNLLKRPVVSMSFADENSVASIQLTGSAERVDDLRLEQEVMYDLARLRYQDPNWPVPTLKFFERGVTNELAIIKVVPTEMTYADFATSETGKYNPFFQKVI